MPHPVIANHWPRPLLPEILVRPWPDQPEWFLHPWAGGAHWGSREYPLGLYNVLVPLLTIPSCIHNRKVWHDHMTLIWPSHDLHIGTYAKANVLSVFVRLLHASGPWPTQLPNNNLAAGHISLTIKRAWSCKIFRHNASRAPIPFWPTQSLAWAPSPQISL